MSATNHNIIVWGLSKEGNMEAQTAVRRVQALRQREEVEHLRKRFSEVTAMAARLIEECRRLRTDNEDLRASAHIWIGMYEKQLERANSSEEQLFAGARRV